MICKKCIHFRAETNEFMKRIKINGKGSCDRFSNAGADLRFPNVTDCVMFRTHAWLEEKQKDLEEKWDEYNRKNKVSS